MKRLHIAGLLIFLSACATQPKIQSFRSEDFTLNDIKHRTYVIKNSKVLYLEDGETDGIWKDFGLREQDYLRQFKNCFVRNFRINGRLSEKNIDDAYIDLYVKVSNQTCETTCFLWGETGIQSSRKVIDKDGNSVTTYTPTYGVTGTYPCQKRYTWINVTVKGYDNENMLFETSAQHRYNILNNDRTRQKILEMIDIVTQHIGEDAMLDK